MEYTDQSYSNNHANVEKYTDRTQSTAINPIAYLPQPYSNNPIQPPQEKTPENLPDITIVIPNTLKGEKSQSIDNNSSNISEQESETDVESMYNVTYVDSKVIYTEDDYIPPAPPYEYKFAYTFPTSETGKKIYNAYKDKYSDGHFKFAGTVYDAAHLLESAKLLRKIHWFVLAFSFDMVYHVTICELYSI